MNERVNVHGCVFSVCPSPDGASVCGMQVFCVVCCDQRCRLSHLDGKEGRVCVSCHFTLMNSGYYWAVVVEEVEMEKLSPVSNRQKIKNKCSLQR